MRYPSYFAVSSLVVPLLLLPPLVLPLIVLIMCLLPPAARAAVLAFVTLSRF